MAVSLGLDLTPTVPQPPELEPLATGNEEDSYFNGNHCGPKSVHGIQAMKGSKVCCQAGKRKYPFWVKERPHFWVDGLSEPA